MRINILEDDLMQQVRMERCIRKLQKELNFNPMILTVESDPDKFLQVVESKGTNQLYLLDIDIEGHSEKAGLETAKKIRTFDPYGAIIFITTHENYAEVTYKYKVSALGFIKKEDSDDYLIEELRSYLIHVIEDQEKVSDEEQISVGQFHSKLQFYPSEALFFEATANREIEVVTKHSRALVKDKLKDIIKLHDDFVFCHRSIIVNKRNIFRIDRENRLIHFENEEYCPISSRKISEIKRYIQN
ncbi:LytR/AlgR family response regulator transcription factor [Marinilactibacillus psychrotolerans]|uniref:LytR/AlgR family response regulator transcription factor n=1 Tax=Marinilactibacillus psychrotolerans TaxID=191770 RepID=UPI001866067E|nr:LytTR family DNA-binding domain-containing protein [Marinilactibacillus psychrotolerans]